MTVHGPRRTGYALLATSAALVALGAGPATAPTLAPTTGPATKPTTKPAAPVAAADTTAVKRGTLHLSFDADGVFEPVDPFEVRFAPKRYAGEFTIRKAIANGTTVAKGDLLLSVDTDPIDRQIAAGESALAVANATVAKAEADVTLGEKSDALAMDYARQSAADAEAGLKRWDTADGPAAVTMGGLQAKQMDNALEDATDELDQLRQMYKTEDLTNKTADIVLKRAVQNHAIYEVYDKVAKVMADRATTYEPAVARHALAAGTAAQQQSVDHLAASQAQVRVVRAASLAGARAAAAEVERALSELKKDRATLTVTSPIDGVVVYGTFARKSWTPIDPKRMAVDEKVSAEQVLMTVYQPGKLKVVVACDESKIAAMAPGTAVSVQPAIGNGPALDGTCGTAARLPSGSTAAATVDVPVTLAKPADASLLPGYAADVDVDVPPVKDVLLVPASAVFHGRVMVHTPDGKDEPRPIIRGATDGKQVQVRSGLAEGDLVLTKYKN